MIGHQADPWHCEEQMYFAVRSLLLQLIVRDRSGYLQDKAQEIHKLYFHRHHHLVHQMQHHRQSNDLPSLTPAQASHLDLKQLILLHLK